MDHFARELIDTGYLHNHARMWWASFWVHVEKLPWQLGAEFFRQQLLDGDAASNTLSWRWVAGLHTKGKSYLVQRSNIEKYVDPRILETEMEGIERLEANEVLSIEFQDPPKPISLADEISQTESGNSENGKTAIWVHDEDLLIEHSPLSQLDPVALFGFTPNESGFSSAKQKYIKRSLADGLDRAKSHFGVESQIVESHEEFLELAEAHSISIIHTMKPFVGPRMKDFEVLRENLNHCGIKLQSHRRPEDTIIMNNATAGFFGFWKKTSGLRKEMLSVG